jgi:hypothetical protein
VPVHDPLNKPSKRKFVNRIKPTNIVIVLSGMYVPQSQWIQAEIGIADYMNKPIIGIKPQGNQNIPQAVREVADEIVNWNTQSIVNAIRRNAI